MSVIVLKQENDCIEMCSDMCFTFGYQKIRPFSDTKIVEVPFLSSLTDVEHVNTLMGFCGSAGNIDLFVEHLQIQRPVVGIFEKSRISKILSDFFAWAEKKYKPFKADKFEALLATEDGGFLINGIWVGKIEDFQAIGNGAEYAMGALSGGGSVRDAVIAASTFDIYCGGVGETRSLNLKRNKYET